ncbi:MAG: Hsp70 family protein, partial [Micrococcales bacterium]|nr:Hsp70 family protein [Micrococcales bacterium]
MSWVLAIDFGSTNTAAAWAVAGRIERVRLEPGSDTMPSAVVLADGQWRVGQAALNARRSHPRTFVASPKARLGHEPVVLGDKFVPAPVIASIVLATVRDRAIRAAGGTPPDRVVLTHPEHWGPQRQAALQEAARLAGFTDEQITMLPEPIAAVRASIEPTSLPPGSRVGVVDVGGGTCDVAVLESTADRGLVVLAREGDERLGGNDFDDLLYQWVLDQLRASNHGDMVQILADPAHIGAALTLLDSVRGAKQDLSDHADAQIAVSVAADNETVVTITRDEYEQLIAEPLERAAALTRQALESSKTAKLTQLFLTGGSAYTPALARALHKVTGHLSTPLGDPKMATATGALRTVLHIAPPAPQKAPAPPVAPADPAPAPAVSDAPAPAPAPPVPSGTDPRSSEGQTAPPQDATTQPAPTQVAAAPVPGATPPTAVIQPVGAPQKASMPQGVYPGPPTPTQPTSPRPMTASPPTHPGPPHAPIDNTRPPKNPNRWRNRVLLM